MAQGSKQCQNSEKAKEMGCHIKVTEPFSPWQNASEGAIREVKKVLEGRWPRCRPQPSCGIIAAWHWKLI